MIISNYSPCKGFVLFCCYTSNGTLYNYTENEIKEDGKFSQLLYVIDGTGQAVDENDNVIFNLKKGELYDFKECQKSKVIFKYSSPTLIWVSINPIPTKKYFTGQVLRSGNHIINGDINKEQNIICIKGNMTINDKQFKELNYATIKSDKVANITIPSGSEAILITR